MTLDARNFDAFSLSLREYGSKQYDGLPDDDDPLGQAIIVPPEGGVTMMAITPGMFAPENLKALFMGVVGAIVKESAVHMGWLVSAYGIDTSEDNSPPPPNFADDPRRFEVFRAIAISHAKVEAFVAPVLRGPSRVGDWEVDKKIDGDPYIEIPKRAFATVARGDTEFAG